MATAKPPQNVDSPAPAPIGNAHMSGTITHARRVGPVVHILFKPVNGRKQIEVALSLDQWQSSGFEMGSTVIASVKYARVFPALELIRAESMLN